MKRAVTMPTTKSQSKQKRTQRPKKCPQCVRYCHELLALTCALERAELERDVMLDVMAKALISAEADYLEAYRTACYSMKVNTEQRDEISRLLTDLQLVQAGCTRELGGSVWVRGEQLAECLNRYTNGTAK